MKKKRSIGVIVVGIVLLVLGGLFFPQFSYHFIWLLIRNRFDLSGNTDLWSWLWNFSKLLSAIIPIILIAAGIGILFLKPWARKLSIFILIPLVYLYAFIFTYCYIRGEICHKGSLISFYSFMFFGAVFLVITLIMSPLVIYLTRSKVKRAFSERNPERSEG